MSGGGGKTKTEYVASPEQRAVYQWLIPLVQQMSLAGTLGTSPYPIPGMPDVPQLPSPYEGLERAMPTKAWWEGIEPGVKEGLYAPWEEAGQRLSEQLSGAGAGGSARGGFSGAIAPAMADLWGQAGQQVPLQAWQMTGPQMQQAWQQDYGAESQRRMLDYQTSMQQTMMPYQQQMQRRGELLQGYQMPYGIMPGMMGGTYSTPIVQQGGGSMLGGAMGGGLAGAGLWMGFPGIAGLAGLGALSSK